LQPSGWASWVLEENFSENSTHCWPLSGILVVLDWY
jgi:hypothetical protein